ncbi:MAG: hypothetical protein H0V51_08085, partial [Chloroflexi bacterium]|nr:hypothetical protein [Chloroflexota bacterium]
MSDAQYAEQFRSGDLFIGRGTFGSGIYTAAGPSGLDHARAFVADEGGVVLRMTIKRGARVADFDYLRRTSIERWEQIVSQLRTE